MTLDQLADKEMVGGLISHCSNTPCAPLVLSGGNVHVLQRVTVRRLC
jgi:hypothetical protein